MWLKRNASSPTMADEPAGKTRGLRTTASRREAPARERLQARRDVGAQAGLDELRDRSPPELLPDDRRALHHLALLRIEAVQACREQRVDRRRDSERVEALLCRPHAGVAGEQAVVDEHPRELLREQR